MTQISHVRIPIGTANCKKRRKNVKKKKVCVAWSVCIQTSELRLPCFTVFQVKAKWRQVTCELTVPLLSPLDIPLSPERQRKKQQKWIRKVLWQVSIGFLCVQTLSLLRNHGIIILAVCCNAPLLCQTWHHCCSWTYGHTGSLLLLCFSLLHTWYQSCAETEYRYCHITLVFCCWTLCRAISEILRLISSSKSD